MSELPIACELSALTNDERDWLIQQSSFLATATKIKETDDGYGLLYRDASTEDFLRLARIMAYDRLCCAFIRHAIVQESGSKDAWLYMSGAAGTKAYIKSEMLRFSERNSAIAKLFDAA